MYVRVASAHPSVERLFGGGIRWQIDEKTRGKNNIKFVKKTDNARFRDGSDVPADHEGQDCTCASIWISYMLLKE